MIRGKKGDLLGGEMMIWIYRFVLIGLIVFVYSVVIFNFYSAEYDVRSSESLFIGKRVIDCVSDEGIVNMDAFSKSQMISCLKIKDESEDVYIGVKLGDLKGKEISGFDIGKNELKPLCGYEIYCSEQKYYFLADDNQKTKMEIFIAIKNDE